MEEEEEEEGQNRETRRAGGHLPDDTVSSLPELLGHSVALIDDEILVENLEHLAAL